MTDSLHLFINSGIMLVLRQFGTKVIKNISDIINLTDTLIHI